MEAKYRIFIVDDDRYNLLLISRKLKETLNCSTRLFQNAQDCLDALQYELPDLVVTDYRLEDQGEDPKDGEHVLNWFKSKRPDIPVIMYSSMASFDLILKMIRKGAVDFIPRDENFLQKLARIVSYQAGKLRRIAGEKRTKRTILITITLVTALMFYFSITNEELLVPYAVSLLVISAMIIFFKDILKRKVYR